jgi:ketosteroid isomerase-like protein
MSMRSAAAASGFANPEAVEDAFYRAFRDGDIETMRAVWSAAGDVVCVHPAHSALSGYAEVMASWESILATTEDFDIRFVCRQRLAADGLVVHVGVEEITAGDGNRVTVPATNAYRRTRGGWQLCLHHASPVQVQAEAGPLH